jgi:Family of unknown function (DUF6428)
MLPQANRPSDDTHPWHRTGQASTRELMAELAPHAGKALVFTYDGRETQAGYHVTEVKDGRFSSIDCGAAPEIWRETVIQLWDIPAEPGREPMSVGKFLAIMRKVAEQVELAGDAKLRFEVSDGVRAMQIFVPAGLDIDNGTVRVALGPQPASCKPRDRLWLLEQEAAEASTGCCAPAKTAKACCG